MSKNICLVLPFTSEKEARDAERVVLEMCRLVGFVGKVNLEELLDGIKEEEKIKKLEAALNKSGYRTEKTGRIS